MPAFFRGTRGCRPVDNFPQYPCNCCQFSAVVPFVPQRPWGQIAILHVECLERIYEEEAWVRSAASRHIDGTQILEGTMKKLALAAALSLAGSSAFAGGMTEVMTTEVITAETSSSAGGIIVPLLLLLVIAAAASN